MQSSTTKMWFKYFLSGALLSVLVMVGGYLLDQKGFFNLNELEIEFVESEQASHFPALIAWKEKIHTKFSSFKGQSLLKLPMKEISKDLMAETWLKNLQLTRRFPDGLSISIVPKKWQALVFNSKSQEFFGLSVDCELLPNLKLSESIDLPLVDSAIVENSDHRILLCELLSQLKEEGIVGKKSISEILWKEDGIAVRLSGSDPLLLLGQNDYSLKLQRVEKVMAYLEEKDLTASVIAAFYQKKVVVKLRKHR